MGLLYRQFQFNRTLIYYDDYDKFMIMIFLLITCISGFDRYRPDNLSNYIFDLLLEYKSET
jgi:hypothetical protein